MDPPSFEKLDPDLYSRKKLDPDPHKVQFGSETLDASNSFALAQDDDLPREGELREQDRFLPIFNISKVRTDSSPPRGTSLSSTRRVPDPRFRYAFNVWGSGSRYNVTKFCV
jgi:hypothetical protein